MNNIAQAANSLLVRNQKKYQTYWLVAIVFLCLSIAVTGFKVIVVSYERSMLVNQYHSLQLEHNGLELTWVQLILEQGTLLNHNRTERLVRGNLYMRAPKAEEIKLASVK